MTGFFEKINYEMAKNILQILISLLVGGVIIVIYNQMSAKFNSKPANLVKKKKKYKLINFNETVKNLKANGVLDKFPKLANPAYYLTIHAILAVIFGILGFYINKILVFPFAILGWVFLDFIFKQQSKSENRELMNDSLTLCNMIMSQIKGGAYIGTAISECRTLVKNKRLQKALNNFYISTATAEKTLLEAIEELESNFNQKDILTICMIVKQSEETGKSYDVLSDLNKQISDTQEEIYIAEKEKLNRRMTIAILLLFTDMIGYVLYLFITNIFSQV